MSNGFRHILLADDDRDDCLFFQDAVEELKLPFQVTVVKDGEQLMQHLIKNPPPHALFLDLNMPRKNGYVCLREIKSNHTLSKIPVVIFSTSYDEAVAESLYNYGAHYYICKPPDYEELKEAIHNACTLLDEMGDRPPLKNFLICGNKIPH